MDLETKKLLQENLELSRANNAMLKKIRSTQRWQQISRAAYLLIIIGVALGAFVYLQPLINQVAGIFRKGSSSGSGTSFTIPDAEHLQDLYNQLNKPTK